MKKLGFAVSLLALTVGLIFAPGCNLGNLNLGGKRGSGTPKTEQRNVAGFKKVEADGAINVEIAAQKGFSVSIEADDNLLPLIKTEVSGDTLKIYSEDRISPKTEIKAKISMPEIEGLDVSGASSGNVSNVNSDSLNLEASGASKIKIDGKVKDLKGEASGASSIDAENLAAENADVNASGASSAIVSATGELRADASGASKIFYTGEPKNIKQNSSGASSISKK